MKTKTRWLIAGIVLAALLVTASSPSAAEIWIDNMEYEPEDTVLISGTGFAANTQLIQITITRPDGTDVCPLNGTCGELPMIDANGNFSNYAYKLDGVEGGYTVNVSDGTNTAQTHFIDGYVTYTVESYESDYTTVKDSFTQGETVYVKATRDPVDDNPWGDTNMKLRFKDPSGNVVYTSPDYGKSPFTCSYTLPNDAPTGQWTIEIGRCNDYDLLCGYGWYWYWRCNYCDNDDHWFWSYYGTPYGTDHFTVTTTSEEFPEFPTIALPALSILGLFLFYNYRKRKGE